MFKGPQGMSLAGNAAAAAAAAAATAASAAATSAATAVAVAVARCYCCSFYYCCHCCHCSYCCCSTSKHLLMNSFMNSRRKKVGRMGDHKGRLTLFTLGSLLQAVVIFDKTTKILKWCPEPLPRPLPCQIPVYKNMV